MRARPPVLLRLRFVLVVSLAWFVLLASAEAQAPTTHFVDVGVNGIPQFIDRDTGKSTLTTNPVPTVIRVGDTVQWVFQYQHSATNGSCPGGICTPASPLLFDSTIQPGPFPSNFRQTFANPGIIPYFCLIHLAEMQGRVVVLNGPDYFLEVQDSNQFFPPPPIPTVAVLAGQAGTFNGTTSGFLGYKSPVNVGCQNGTPRVPSSCPVVSVTPDGNGTVIPFSLAVTDSQPGTYTFDIVAVGTDPNHITKRQQVQLQVSDLAMQTPSPATLLTVNDFFLSSSALQLELQSIGGFTGFVNLNCMGLPANAFCIFNPNFFFLTPGSSQSVSMQASAGFSEPGIYAAEIQANSFFAGNSISRSQPFTFKLLPALGLALTTNSTAFSGTPTDLMVSAMGSTGLPISSYSQTVHFTSTDPTANLPADYPFLQISDAGVHTFSVKLNKLGPRTVTATDLSVFATTGTSPIIFVQPSSQPNNNSTVGSSRAPLKDAYFRNDNVVFTVTVAAASGSVAPTGKVHLFDGAQEITPAAGISLAALSPAKGRATFTIAHLRPGGHMISAVYDGDSTFAASVSQPFSQPRSAAPHCNADRCPGSH